MTLPASGPPIRVASDGPVGDERTRMTTVVASSDRRGRWRRAGFVLLALLVFTVAALVVWAAMASPAEPGPLQAAREDPDVEVDLAADVELRPAGREPRRGVVFYPGARVSPDAYVATWAPIVEATDTLVVIPSMPLNLAVFGRGRAAEVIAEHPDIEQWWVGGHSLGGAMAASWLGGQPRGEIEGLVLWASFATEGADLEDREELRVLSISGSRDGLSTPQETSERDTLLPDDAVRVEIDGMNHAQFGRYGSQSGDRGATITDAAAQQALTEAHASFWSQADGSVGDTR